MAVAHTKRNPCLQWQESSSLHLYILPRNASCSLFASVHLISHVFSRLCKFFYSSQLEHGGAFDVHICPFSLVCLLAWPNEARPDNRQHTAGHLKLISFDWQGRAPSTDTEPHQNINAATHQHRLRYQTTSFISDADPTMAGGKGKSSGGKSSGGKVGADGNKKQQSHSSKAGLQVSAARLKVLLCHSISGVLVLDDGVVDRYRTFHPAKTRSKISTGSHLGHDDRP